MGKISEDYLREYYKMEQVYLDKSKNMSLYDILTNIKDDKSYIFNFIKHDEIKKIIRGIKNKFKFNKDEAEDVAVFVITEYLCETKVDLNMFDEDIFLSMFKEEVNKRSQKMIRQGYSSNDIPSTATNKYEKALFENFENNTIDFIDLENAFSKISERDREILESRVYDRLSEAQLAQKFNLSRSRISEIINETCDKMKKYL